jgi:hypothetical protein
MSGFEKNIADLFIGLCYILVFFILLALAEKYLTKTNFFKKILKKFESL